MMTVVAHSEFVGNVVKVKEVLAVSNVGNRLNDLII